MRLEECYRLLELTPGASADEVRRAHRDLTKVWHPDRFGHDADLRRKAEEKLKAINEAYETILGERPESQRPRPASEGARAGPRWQVNAAAWALAAAALAIFILLRRPTPAGLIIAILLFFVSSVFIRRLRR